MQLAIPIIFAFITGIIFSFPIPMAYKLALPLLPIVAVFFALKPFTALLMLLIFRPELEVFRESGMLRYFSAVPIAFFFTFIGTQHIDFCWKKMKYLYLFALVTILSLIYSINIKESFIHILRLLSIIAIYLLAFNLLKTKDDVRKALYCFPLAMIIPMLIGVKQFIGGETYVTENLGLTRVEGLFVLANSFARFLFITLFASIPLIYFKKTRKFFLYAVIACGTGMIILLRVRGVFLALIAAVFILFYFTPKIRRYFWIIIPAFIILSLIMTAALGLFERLLNPLQDKVYGGDPWFWRMEIWQQLIANAFPRKPFLGYGTGASANVSHLYTTFEHYPHNDYLRVLIENGILGLIFYLSFFISNLKSSLRAIKSDENRYLNVCAFINTATFLFMSFAANIFYAVDYFWYFFAFLAIAHKANEISRHCAPSERAG